MQSLWLDLRVIARTIKAVVRREGIAAEGEAQWRGSPDFPPVDEETPDPLHCRLHRGSPPSFLKIKPMVDALEATVVAFDPRSAANWDKGITIIHRGRVYPDGRIVRYPEPKLPDVRSQQTAIGGKVSLARAEQVTHPRCLGVRCSMMSGSQIWFGALA